MQNCTLENKSKHTCEYHPDELDDNLIENNTKVCSYHKKFESVILRETMRCSKVRRILRYHVPNKLFYHYHNIFISSIHCKRMSLLNAESYAFY